VKLEGGRKAVHAAGLINGKARMSRDIEQESHTASEPRSCPMEWLAEAPKS